MLPAHNHIVQLVTLNVQHVLEQPLLVNFVLETDLLHQIVIAQKDIMMMELQPVLNVMEIVPVVKLPPITVLNVPPEETLHQNVFVMMEPLMIMVFVLLVQLNALHVIPNSTVLNVQKLEKKYQLVNVLMVPMM